MSAMVIDPALMFRALQPRPSAQAGNRPPDLPPGVVPAGMAQDSQSVAPMYTWANQFGCANTFPGYALLSQLSQISEYRAPVETLAKEMTRRWIKLITKGEGEKADKLEKIEARMKELNVQDTFRRISEIDGFFGRAMLYIQIKGNDDARTPLLVDPATIPVGSLMGFQTIEPIWTSPSNYNASDPTRADFYKPTTWFILGRQTDATRLLTFVSRPVTDILKPQYNFGGLSLSQLMRPYVENWFSTRDHVNDLLRNFSTLVLSTNLQGTLSGDASDSLGDRVTLMNRVRDNNGCVVVDKDTEELAYATASLAGLHELKAQAQENMCAPSHMPLVKLTGITPSGLNASSDGEIQVWYDHIHSEQEVFFRPHLTEVIRIIQLDLFGAIDDGIDFEFVPLEEPSAADLAAVRKSDADMDVAYITASVVSPDEVRDRLARDPNSGYTNLSGEAPEPPDLEEEKDDA